MKGKIVSQDSARHKIYVLEGQNRWKSMEGSLGSSKQHVNLICQARLCVEDVSLGGEGRSRG